MLRFVEIGWANWNKLEHKKGRANYTLAHGKQRKNRERERAGASSHKFVAKNSERTVIRNLIT